MIQTVGNTGLVTVAFSDNIIIPANFTNFNDAFLGIRLILG